MAKYVYFSLGLICFVVGVSGAWDDTCLIIGVVLVCTAGILEAIENRDPS
ncbi:MAG: hypothetical protein AAFY82_00185 [Pseudomonadota bacterium]